jgi:hypothetical protein
MNTNDTLDIFTLVMLGVLIFIVFGFITLAIFRSKGRSGWIGFALGFLGIIGIIIALLVPSTKTGAKVVSNQSEKVIREKEKQIPVSIMESLCESCGHRSGPTYVFYYGKKKDDWSHPGEGGRVTTTRYSIGGSQHMAMCDGCVNRYRLFAVLKTLVPALVILGLGFGLHSDDILGLGWFPVLVLVIMSLGSLFRSKQKMGVKVAINLREKALRTQGWDTIWTQEEYSKLKPDDTHWPF